MDGPSPRASSRWCPAGIVVAACIGLTALACGAKTGLETPPPCGRASDCPPLEDFCSATVACTAGYCALEDAPDCADESACTVDACDSAAMSCMHPLRDRDADGFLDGSCGGDDCDDHDPAVHPGARERCEGGRDEDCDGAFDCSDTDCAADTCCALCDPEACEGGADEDCDGAVDCADADCVCCEAGETRCDDARDDDCDGAVDCLDDECAFARTCCVPAAETCNGLDDDCDGTVDDGVPCFFLDGAPIDAVVTPLCGPAWYTYDSPDEASAHPSPDLRGSGRVAVAIVLSPASCGGASVAVIADQVEDGSGGALMASFTTDRAGTGGVLVSDDPPECRWDATSRTGSCDWRWQPCCTDGVLIGPLGGDFCVVIELGFPAGVTNVVVFDGATETRPRGFGEPIELCGRTIPAVP